MCPSSKTGNEPWWPLKFATDPTLSRRWSRARIKIRRRVFEIFRHDVAIQDYSADGSFWLYRAPYLAGKAGVMNRFCVCEDLLELRCYLIHLSNQLPTEVT